MRQSGTYFCILYLVSFLVMWQTAFAGADTTYYTLSIPKGQKKSAFPINTRATAAVWNDSAALYVRIQVHDTDLVLNNDPIHSDHAELWVALPNEEINTNQYILARDTSEHPYHRGSSDTTLWLCNGKADTAALRNELSHPSLSWLTGTGDDSIDYLASFNRLSDQIDNLQSKLIRPIRVPLGQSHYGFLPGKHKANLYDLEYVHMLERCVANSSTVDNFLIHNNLLNRIGYKSVKLRDGYSITATIPTSALVYFSSFGSANLRILIDVIDAHSNKTSETLFSNSSTRQWGNALTYGAYKPSTPIKNSSLFALIPPRHETNDARIFFNSESGWRCFSSFSSPISFSNRNEATSAPNIQQVSFQERESGVRTFVVKKLHIRIYTLSDNDHASGRADCIQLENGTEYTAEHCVEPISLPNGRLGFLVANAVDGGRDCESDDILRLVTLNELDKSIAFEYAEEPSGYPLPDTSQVYRSAVLIRQTAGYDSYVKFGDDEEITAAALNLDPLNEFIQGECSCPTYNWESAIHWVKPGKSFTVDVNDNGKVLVKWSDDGRTVSYKKID